MVIFQNLSKICSLVYLNSDKPAIDCMTGPGCYQVIAGLNSEFRKTQVCNCQFTNSNSSDWWQYVCLMFIHRGQYRPLGLNVVCLSPATNEVAALTKNNRIRRLAIWVLPMLVAGDSKIVLALRRSCTLGRVAVFHRLLL